MVRIMTGFPVSIPAGPPPADAAATARVVAVDATQVWLEPMQTGSCGGCVSAASCGSKGIGILASRLEARRFAVPGAFALHVGDVVEIGFDHARLVQAAAVAYGLPLLLALAVAVLVQARFGQDGLTLLGMSGGLLAGFLVSRLFAARLEARGVLQARLVGIVQQAAPTVQTIHFSLSGEQRDA